MTQAATAPAADTATDSNSIAQPGARRRMTPEDRKRHILDATAQVVVEEGVAAVSMDRVAKMAGVSKPLVYNYFDNRANLLSTLLVAKFPAFQGTRIDPLPGETFEQLVRRTTVEFVDRYIEDGVLIQRLMNEPLVAAGMIRQQEKGRIEAARFFGDHMAREFGVAKQDGQAAAELAMGITSMAARMLVKDPAEHDRIIDMTVTMIVGAVRELGER